MNEPVAPPARQGLREHPQRRHSINEMHARPYAQLQTPARVSHLLLLSGEQAADQERDCVRNLCERYNSPTPGPHQSHFSADFSGLFRIRWERHTEFSVYTFIREVDADEPFRETALDQIPTDWLATLPGELLVGMHLALINRAAGESNAEPDVGELKQFFASNTVTGAWVTGGKALAWTDHQLHADGFSRVLLQDRGLNRRSAGRLLQRVIEINDYRMMALLALPVARQLGTELTELESLLNEFTDRLNDPQSAEGERRLLSQLTRLAARAEQLASQNSYRFSASQAYYALVQRRLDELREQRIEGLQTFQEFQHRRLAPAMATCDSVAARLNSLNTRIARASNLLRTRVDISLEEQNRDLLASMDRRAQLQLRLQEMVEGLSVVVLSYYLVGLIAYLLKGGKSLLPGLAVDALIAAAVLPTVGAVYLGLRRLRRRIERHDAT